MEGESPTLKLSLSTNSCKTETYWNQFFLVQIDQDSRLDYRLGQNLILTLWPVILPIFLPKNILIVRWLKFSVEGVYFNIFEFSHHNEVTGSQSWGNVWCIVNQDIIRYKVGPKVLNGVLPVSVKRSVFSKNVKTLFSSAKILPMVKTSAK